MPLLQVTECPEDIYKKIANSAQKQKRTISQQVILLLEKCLGREESNLERRKNLLTKIKSRKISDEIKALDAAALIREDRDR